MNGLWPDDGSGTDSFEDVFAPRPDIDAWVSHLEHQGVDVTYDHRNDLAVLHVPEEVAAEGQSAWIAAHSPPAGWGGRLVVVTYDR